MKNKTTQKQPAPTDTKALAVISKELGRGGSFCKEFNRVRLVDSLDWQIEKAYAMEIIRNSPALQNADPATIGRSLIDLSVMGLSLSPARKEAYLIPYWIKGLRGDDGKAITNCSASPSYMGLEQVLYRTGYVTLIESDVVREGDIFEEWSDPNSGKQFKHVKAAKRGDITHAWCVVSLTSGKNKVEVMDSNALRACRDAAANKNNGQVPFVWLGDFREEMYKKCPVRRAFKHVPKVKNPEVTRMLEALERADPMDFSANDATITDISERDTLATEQINVLIKTMIDAGFPEGGVDRQLQGLAAGLGFRNVNSILASRFEDAASLLERGLERWKARTAESASGQEGATQPTQAAS